MTNDESHHLSVHDQVINRFRFKIATWIFFKYALMLTTIWCFLWGTAVLALRASYRTPRWPLLWGLAGVWLVAAAAVFLARRQVPTHSTVRALLDRQSGHGGLLMAAEETHLGMWQQRLSSVTTPRLRWRGGRTWGLLAMAALFVAISFLVPLRFVAVNADHPLEIGHEVKQLTEQIQTLKEEQIIDQSKAETLQKKLEQVQQEASGDNPVKTWEALDHLQDNVSKMAQEAAQDGLADTQRLTESETLAEGLKAGGSELDPALMADAMKELAAMTKATLRDVPLLDKKLSEQLQKALNGGSLTPEQLKELASALRQSKADIAKQLQKLHEAKLVDLKTLKACEKAGQCNSEGLAAFLAENKENDSVSELTKSFCRGGTNRGRGDAAMTWTDGTSEEGAQFKEQILPGSLSDLETSQLVGVSAGAPTVETGHSQSGALNGAMVGGGSAHTQTVLPQHRGTVRRYFERP